MYTDVFYWLVSMSLMGSFTGLCVLLLRRWRRLPRRFAFLLWLIPALRFWSPVGVVGPFNLATLLSMLFPRMVVVPISGPAPNAPTEDAGYFALANCAGYAESYFPIVYRSNPIREVFSVAGTIWVLGAAVLLLTFGLIYVITRRETMDAVHLRDRIYVSDKVTAPATYGIFRPRIVIPESWRERDLTFLVLHEQTHIRRLDNLWRVLALATAAIHWFNPLVWFFLRVFLQDLELACDERVLVQCGADNKKAYAAALLDSAPRRNVFVSAFGGAKLRLRLENILSYDKMSVFSMVCFVVLLLVVAYVLLTNPAAIRRL